MKKINKISILLSLLFILIIAFILFNAFLDSNSSHKLSSVIMEFFFSNSTENDGVVDDFWFRKVAHFIEYAVLGVGFGWVVIFFRRHLCKDIIGGSLFAILSISVLDELIQEFNGRNSSVRDIILDFGAALIGLVFTLFIIWFLNNIKAKKKQTPRS